MQKWLHQKTGESVAINPDAFADEIEMLGVAGKASLGGGGGASSSS
jgi:hypothetical protein